MLKRIKFWLTTDRIGPDIPLTYWMLFFPVTMKLLCKKRFGKFGERSEMRPGSFALDCRKIKIGSDVTIRAQSILMADPRENGAEIIIGDKVLMGPGVHIYVNDHKYVDTTIPIFDQDHTDPKIEDSVVIKEGSWIGARATILKGVHIGKNAVVAAGSVVTKNVEEKTLVAGVPAKMIKRL